MEPDAAQSGKPAAAVFCDPADVHTVACYELDGNVDDASHDQLVTMRTANAVFAPGHLGMALVVGPGTEVDVGDSQALDLATLTLDAWINPTALPIGGGRAFIVDVDNQYGLYLESSGAVACPLINGPSVSSGGPGGIKVAPGAWVHVACTFDGASATVYVGGVAAETRGGRGPLATNGNGMAIGANYPDHSERLTGLIDQLRLRNVARTASEVCADSGRLDCP